MSVQVKSRRESASFLATFVGAQGELLVDTTNSRLQVHDGATPGGFPAAKLSEVSPLSPLMQAAVGANGSLVQIGTLEGAIEAITPGGLTFVSALQIPARTMVIGVSHRLITAITGCTAFEIGVAGTPSMFATGLNVAAPTHNVGIGGPNTFYAATPLLLTSTAGGNFTGGSIRLSIQYISIGAPTS